MSTYIVDIYSSLVHSYNDELNSADQCAVVVHACCLAQGWLEDSFFDQVMPRLARADLSSHSFRFRRPQGEPVEVKCVVVGGDRFMVHASDSRKIFTASIPLAASIEEMINSIDMNIIRPLHGERRPASLHQPASHRPPLEEPTRPSQPFPSSNRRSGELVGPNDPIFGGRPENPFDPRFDPIGPGHIGEPDDDHFAPPPFGQPRTSRGPLRGPNYDLF
jgi:hypothetical protein